MLACGAAGTVRAQDESLHWAYAAFFGTGRYSLDGLTDTTVLGISPGWTWREPALGESGARTIGYRFKLPVSIGAHEFSLDLIDELTLDSVNIVSVVPGAEIGIPMSERWSLKAIGNLGFGLEIGGGEKAWIFRLSLRSQFAFELGDTRMLLVNGLERYGYSENDGASDALNMFKTGLDFSRPLADIRIGDAPLAIHWHVMYTSYIDSLDMDFSGLVLEPATIDSEWELGLGFGRQTGRVGIWRIRFDRVGLAYRFGADGEFTGVGIVFRSLFDR